MRWLRTTFYIVLVAIAGIIILSVSAQEISVEDQNIQLIEAYAQAELDRNYDVMDEYLAVDFVRHSTSPTAPVIESREDFLAFLQETATMFPDYANTIQTIVANDEYVAAQAAFAGTFVGNGERVEFPFNAFWRIEDGRIAELWVNWNDLLMLPQMGMLPPVEQLMAPAIPESAMDEVEVVKALGTALNNGDLDEAMSYMAEDSYFGTFDMGPSTRVGKAEIRELFEGLIAGNFRIETNIVAVHGDDNILISQTQTWGDGITEMGMESFMANEVYLVNHGEITGITWILADETRNQLLAMMAPPPVTAEDIVGTWRWGYGDTGVEFREDGSYRWSAFLFELTPESPVDVGTYVVEDGFLTMTSGESINYYCNVGDAVTYALEFDEEDTLYIAIQSDRQSDPCWRRRPPTSAAQPFTRVEETS